MRIDSPGGDVYEGFAIASAIQRYEGETHAYIDGMAASAASYVALMADKVTMNDYSMFMIHNAWGLCIGNRLLNHIPRRIICFFIICFNFRCFSVASLSLFFSLQISHDFVHFSYYHVCIKLS